MKKYRKKPVVIEAQQWFPDQPHPEVDQLNFRYDIPICFHCGKDDSEHGSIKTLEGIMTVCPGDYVIKGIKDEYYACKPDIFWQTYEEVEDEN